MFVRYCFRLKKKKKKKVSDFKTCLELVRMGAHVYHRQWAILESLLLTTQNEHWQK